MDKVVEFVIAKYKALKLSPGDFPFREIEKINIIEEDKVISAKQSTTIHKYYNETDKEKQQWNNTYIHRNVNRKLLCNCSSWELQKDLDRAVFLGNGECRNSIEGVVVLIISYI